MIAPLLVCGLLAAKPNASFQPRSRPYDALSYRIDLRLADDDAFNNKLTLTLKPKRGLADFDLDAYNLEVASVTIDGQAATFKTKADTALRVGTLEIKPAKALAA